MFRFLPLVLVAVLTSAAAQPHTPAASTAERRAILDAVRGALARGSYAALRAPVEFYDVNLRADGPWAFVIADPRRPGGAPTAHCDADTGDSPVEALLRRTNGAWRVVEWGTCASDVFYQDWPERYGAAPPLFGFGWPAATSAYVSASDGFLSLRSEPSASRGTRLARMPNDARLSVLSCREAIETVDGVGGRWCRVRHDGREGWAFNGFLLFARD